MNPSQKVDFFSSLPAETSFHLLSHLKTEDFPALMQVSRQGHSVTLSALRTFEKQNLALFNSAAPKKLKLKETALIKPEKIALLQEKIDKLKNVKALKTWRTLSLKEEISSSLFQSCKTASLTIDSRLKTYQEQTLSLNEVHPPETAFQFYLEGMRKVLLDSQIERLSLNWFANDRAGAREIDCRAPLHAPASADLMIHYHVMSLDMLLPLLHDKIMVAVERDLILKLEELKTLPLYAVSADFYRDSLLLTIAKVIAASSFLPSEECRQRLDEIENAFYQQGKHFQGLEVSAQCKAVATYSEMVRLIV